MTTKDSVRLIEATIQWINDDIRLDPQNVLFGVSTDVDEESLPYDEQVFFWLTPDEAAVLDATGTLPEEFSDEWKVIPTA